MVQVRPWAYRLWKQGTKQSLVTLKKDGIELEALIHEHGEWTAALAWALYIVRDPPLYHLEPVMHVDDFTSRKGNRIVTQVADESAITKFALASFLTVPTGFIVDAGDLLDSLTEETVASVLNTPRGWIMGTSYPDFQHTMNEHPSLKLIACENFQHNLHLPRSHKPYTLEESDEGQYGD